MRGSIYKRGVTWTVVYDEASVEGTKRRQRSKGGFATRREAQAFLNDQIARLSDGSYAQPTKQTFREYLNGEWLPSVEATLRPLSVAKYQSTIKLYVIRELGALRLQAVSPGHINGVYRKLEERGLSGHSA